MNFLGYLLRSRTTRTQMIFVVFLVGFCLLFFPRFSNYLGLPDIWQNWGEVCLALVTVSVAVFIWYNEKKQDWENSLPKKLDVSFVHESKDFYRVKNAPLASENDVRQWGQSIGQQMNDGKPLSFTGFYTEAPRRAKNSAGDPITQYEVRIWLQKIDPDKQPTEWVYDDDGRLVEERLLTDSASSELLEE